MKPAYFPAPGFFGNPFVVPTAFPPLAPPPPERGCGCGKTPHYHEGGSDCCRPASACCGGDRRCRKETRELLVEGRAVAKEVIGQLNPESLQRAKTVLRTFATISGDATLGNATDTSGAGGSKAAEVLLNERNLARLGFGEAFIGGGCCVHLSIEYMPETPLAPTSGVVAVLVVDSDKTVMAWARQVAPTGGYQIQEDIITTHPGAKLMVVALNLVARARWCEVFSG